MSTDFVVAAVRFLLVSMVKLYKMCTSVQLAQPRTEAGSVLNFMAH